MAELRIGTLGAAWITPAALIAPARELAEVEIVSAAARDRARVRALAEAILREGLEPHPARGPVAVMRVIDATYRAAGLTPRSRPPPGTVEPS